MHPLSDKDLDRLSREAAEQYDVEQSTSGWEKLEQKLNKHLPEKGKKERRRFIFFIWLFALLSGGGLLWMLSSTPSSRIISLKEGFSEVSPRKSTTHNQTASTEPNSEKRNGPDSDINLPLTDKNPQSKLPENPKTESIKGEDYAVENPNADKKGTGNIDKVNTAINSSATTANGGARAARENFSTRNQGPRTGKSSVNNNTVASRNDRRADEAVPPTTVPTPSHEKTVMERHDKKEDTDETVVVDTEVDRKDVAAIPDSIAKMEKKSIPDNANITPDEAIAQALDSNKNQNKSADIKANGFKKGLHIGVVVAPDMSNVRFTHTDKVGYNIGLQFGYRMSERWSVNTGLIYTRKNYTSQGKDFNPPKGSWLDNVTLDMVSGYCDMFDIPLNVRYDLNNGRRQRFFVSSGLSTYLMKKEEYHYHYQYPNGNPGYRYRSSSSDENHFMSVLNISAGFERKISNRFSVQAEPYLKIPLAGLGYGNLRLNSYGMYFHLKFNAKKH